MADKRKLRSAIKSKDGWWASIFAGPIANRLLEPICDIKFVTPNLITVASFLIGVVAAVCFAIGEPLYLIIGGVLVQLSFITDCMDGQLARYRQQFSDFGAWLDRVSDRVKDFLYFVSLAYGYYRIHGDPYSSETVEAWLIWPLAMTASFAIFLIDYYVNQDMKLKALDANKNQLSLNISKKKSNSPFKLILKSVLQLGLQVYRAIPILRFNIGEQAFLLSAFCFFNAVFEMMVFFALLGCFYVVYWPVAKLYGYTEAK